MLHPVVFRIRPVDGIAGDFVGLKEFLRHPPLFAQQTQGLAVLFGNSAGLEVVEIGDLDFLDHLPSENLQFLSDPIGLSAIQAIGVQDAGIVNLLGQTKPGLLFFVAEEVHGFVGQIRPKTVSAQQLIQTAVNRVEQVSNGDLLGPAALGTAIPGVEIERWQEHAPGRFQPLEALHVHEILLPESQVALKAHPDVTRKDGCSPTADFLSEGVERGGKQETQGEY